MFLKQMVAEVANIYAGKLRKKVTSKRKDQGKKLIEDSDDDDDPQPPKGRQPEGKDRLHNQYGL